MDTPASADAARPGLPALEWAEHAASTQDVMLERAAADPASVGHGAALATDDQRAGHGRRGRQWVAAPGAALALSVAVRPAGLAPVHFTWVSLVMAAEAVGELRSRGVQATVKWPNDVLAPDGRKLAGIIAAALPAATAADGTEVPAGVLVGIGVNLDLSAGAPVETAAGLAEFTSDVPSARELAESARELAEALRNRLTSAAERLAAALDGVAGPVDGDHPALAEVTASLDTLGRRVRADLPDGTELIGRAAGLGHGGTLLLEKGGPLLVDPEPGADHDRMGRREISAADVVHLRPLPQETPKEG